MLGKFFMLLFFSAGLMFVNPTPVSACTMHTVHHNTVQEQEHESGCCSAMSSHQDQSQTNDCNSRGHCQCVSYAPVNMLIFRFSTTLTSFIANREDIFFYKNVMLPSGYASIWRPPKIG